jgi:hypothetical protein
MRKCIPLLLIAISLTSTNCKKADPFPITDLHIHLKGDFTIEDAVIKSKAENISYGIVINCGLNFPVHQDSQIFLP